MLATPRLIALCEEATCRATDGHLNSAQSSVATRVQFDHLAPVAIGSVVLAEATLVKVEGRRLTFTVSAARLEGDGGGLVGAGRVTRVVVDRARSWPRRAPRTDPERRPRLPTSTGASGSWPGGPGGGRRS